MRARSGQRRARVLMALLFGAGSLIGCRPQPVETPEPSTAGSVAWMPGQDAGEDEPAEPEDDGTQDLICAEDPEAPGCPWDRNAKHYDGDAVYGNHNPDLSQLPEAPPPEPCPDSAVLGDMIEIPAGSFEMGCSDGDRRGCGTATRKAVSVTLPAYEIDRTEVTQAAYERCIEAGACTAPAGGFEPAGRCTHPVVNVTWKQAGQYCAWQDKRLPTEAEWEKAARGTDARRYPWGDEAPTCDLANFEGCGLRSAEAVGSHPSGASPYGVLDMAGNVREWVFDREEGRARQPKRGIRGGMFTDMGINLRSGRQSWGDVSVSDIGIGFRCAKSPGPT